MLQACSMCLYIYSAIISRGPPVAKASNENGSDGEERKLGEQTGLDRTLAKVRAKAFRCCCSRCNQQHEHMFAHQTILYVVK
jgi:hypothetical protein